MYELSPLHSTNLVNRNDMLSKRTREWQIFFNGRVFSKVKLHKKSVHLFRLKEEKFPTLNAQLGQKETIDIKDLKDLTKMESERILGL